MMDVTHAFLSIDMIMGYVRTDGREVLGTPQKRTRSGYVIINCYRIILSTSKY